MRWLRSIALVAILTGSGHAGAQLTAAPPAHCWRAWLVAVERVIDGDTFEGEVQVWPRLTLTERVRVLGVDTPERAEIERWKAARDFTDQWLRYAGPTTVTVCRYDNFGRVLGAVVSVAKGNLADALIAAGHGAVYRPGKEDRRE